MANRAWQKCCRLLMALSAENPKTATLGSCFRRPFPPCSNLKHLAALVDLFWALAPSDHRFEPPSQAASHFFDIHFLPPVSLKGPI